MELLKICKKCCVNGQHRKNITNIKISSKNRRVTRFKHLKILKGILWLKISLKNLAFGHQSVAFHE